MPSSGFYGTFWFHKICDDVTVYGVPPRAREALSYSTANFVMHNIHNFTTEHAVYRAMSSETAEHDGGGGQKIQEEEGRRGGSTWSNLRVKPLAALQQQQQRRWRRRNVREVGGAGLRRRREKSSA